MLDYDQVIKIAQIMGYDPKKPTELTGYIMKISKMDSWEISRILTVHTRGMKIAIADRPPRRDIS